jgi:hypothetical protein
MLFYIESLVDFAVTNRYEFKLADIFEAVIRNTALAPLYWELDLSRIRLFKHDERTESVISQFEAMRGIRLPHPSPPVSPEPHLAAATNGRANGRANGTANGTKKNDKMRNHRHKKGGKGNGQIPPQ